MSLTNHSSDLRIPCTSEAEAPISSPKPVTLTWLCLPKSPLPQKRYYICLLSMPRKKSNQKRILSIDLSIIKYDFIALSLGVITEARGPTNRLPSDPVNVNYK